MPKSAKQTERKNLRFPTYILKNEHDDNEGVITHIISVMGIVDSHKDIIKSGAYTKTISESKRIKVLDNHRTDSSSAVVGRPLSLREVGRNELPPQLLADYPDATGALIAETKYNLKTQLGKDIYELVIAGDISEYSVGIILTQFHFDETKLDNGQSETVRVITETKLVEYSTVIWGANPATQTLAGEIELPTDIEFSYADPAIDKAMGKEGSVDTSEDEAILNSNELIAQTLQLAQKNLLNDNDIDAARRLEKTLANIFTQRQIKQLSLSQQVQLVRVGFYRQFPDIEMQAEWWVKDVFDDTLTVRNFLDPKIGRVFSVPYTIDTEQAIVTFAPMTEWTEGRYEFVAQTPLDSGSNDETSDDNAETEETPLTSSLDTDLEDRRQVGLERLKKLQTVLN